MWTGEEIELGEEGQLPLPLRRATTWTSRTPFVLTRHPKRHNDGRPKLDPDGVWRDGPYDQVGRKLGNAGVRTTIAACEDISGSR